MVNHKILVFVMSGEIPDFPAPNFIKGLNKMVRIATVQCECGSIYTKFIDIETDIDSCNCPNCGEIETYEIIIDDGDYWIEKENSNSLYIGGSRWKTA